MPVFSSHRLKPLLQALWTIRMKVLGRTEAPSVAPVMELVRHMG